MAPRELFSDFWQMLIGRVDGPMTIRFIMQPLVASALAFRSALKDAKCGHPPYIWSIFSNPASRHVLLRHGWKDIRNVFVMAVPLDIIYQIIELHWVYLGQAAIVAVVLAIVPYLLVRGPASHLVSMIRGTPRIPFDNEAAPVRLVSCAAVGKLCHDRVAAEPSAPYPLANLRTHE